MVGVFRSRIGLGRGAELLAREMEGRGAQVTRVDATHAIGLEPNTDRTDVAEFADLPALPVDDLVIHLNPPEFLHLLLGIGPLLLRRLSITGYWAWELDRAPRSWEASLSCVDQLWVPSRFVADALKGTFPGAAAPIEVVPYAVELDAFAPPSPAERARARTKLGFASDDFVVLTSFSMLSTLARKNPIGAIEAFRQAFPASVAASKLVLRCLDPDAFPEGLASLREAASGDRRIALEEVRARNSSIQDHYFAADLYLSLHRGEGFGLNLAEALLLGLPVVATGWSLTEWLARHPLMHTMPSTLVPVEDPQGVYDIPGAHWAEPDIAAAAEHLRRLRETKSRPAVG